MNCAYKHCDFFILNGLTKLGNWLAIVGFSISEGKIDGSGKWGKWFSALGRVNTGCIGSNIHKPVS